MPRTWVLPRTTLEVGGRTIVMGIVNVTPDSFSDGGLFLDPQQAIAHALKLLEEGADILDVGGESTRPGAEPVGVEEELRRVIPVVEGICAQAEQAVVSIDTMKAQVARRALEAGAQIVNDVSAMRYDPAMVEVVREFGAGLVLMHMRGEPRTMQKDVHYDDVVGEVRAFLAERVEAASKAGIPPERVVVDPGIGFGKLLEHNLALIAGLKAFRGLGAGVLLGASRKSFIGQLTGRQPQERLFGTIGAHVAGALMGADIVRVHDVGPVREALIVADAIRAAEGA